MIDQGVYTNGTNLTTENVKALKQYCKWVYVSVDAASKDAYKDAKGVDKFGDVCRGILDLVQADGEATIGMGFLVTRDNWRDILKAWELSRALGADYIQYRPAVLFDPANPGKLAEDTEWLDGAMDLLENAAKCRDVIVDLERFRMYRDWQGHKYPVCYWSGVQATITPNGKVWTCVNKREYPGAELGDINKEKFVSIWKRRKIAEVDEQCRVVCRGHPANLILNELMRPNEHGNFI
jgi:MoaA/NifB/PqqE/SkfB family radical SAM enzyme